MFGVEGTSSLHFATNAKMIGGGLDEQLEKFVREYSDTKLVIVDTLQKVREAVSDSYCDMQSKRRRGQDHDYGQFRRRACYARKESAFG